MEDEEGPRYEFRAWAPSFPALPRPEQEPWEDEIYLIPLGLLTKSVKIRGKVLEIKEMVHDRDGLQLWRPAARLIFPIPAITLERELMVLIKIGQPLRRERYGPDELIEDVAEARRNVVAVPMRKRRHVFEVEACRAECTEVEVAGHRIMTAAAEHPEPSPLLRAVQAMKLDTYVNLAYPAELDRLRRVA
jgi:hypothetical protein